MSARKIVGNRQSTMESLVKIIMSMDLNFYKNKKVFITGHTGFKGTWLCKVLEKAGAKITGYSLLSPTWPNIFELSNLKTKIQSVIADIRDFDTLKVAFDSANPEIVFHLAAQPIVSDGYKNPRYTYETNVMGTVNILECIRNSKNVRSFVNVTTDKVYKNNEWEWGYRENEQLDGFDPYSNSKSCSELVTHSYKSSFFSEAHIAVSTARAGNVIGGGDFSNNRIIPDCVRAVLNHKNIIIRNPGSVRPYQHVLEPICVYLMIAEKQYKNSKFSGYYNVGPDECDCITTGELVDLFCKKWKGSLKAEIRRIPDAPHEANFLKLDCSKLKRIFNWKPRWNIETAVEKTVDWTRTYIEGGNVSNIIDVQIDEFLKDF